MPPAGVIAGRTAWVGRWSVGAGDPDGAADAGAPEAAVAVGDLVEVLLVVVLGVEEGAAVGDLGGDLSVAGLGQVGLELLAALLGQLEVGALEAVDAGPVLGADVVEQTSS
jgi:hypothetical protein